MGEAGFSSLASTMAHSVVIMREATEEESRRALLTTLAGSMIPVSYKFS